MPKTYGAWSNEIKLIFPGGTGGGSSSSRSSSSSRPSSSSAPSSSLSSFRSSSSSGLSSTISLVCKNINLEIINGNNTYTGNIINPPAIGTGGNIVTAKIVDTTSANNFTHYEIFVNGNRYLTSQKEMQFVLDLNNLYEFEARSVCLASSSSINLGTCIQTIMSVENNGTIFTGEINEPPAQASNNRLEVRLTAPQNVNISNLSFWEVAINEKVYAVPANQNKFIFNGVAGSIYNIQARAVCEIVPSSSSSSIGGGGGGSSSTTTIAGCAPIKITDIESIVDNMKQRRYRFQFCISDNSWIDTNQPTQAEINDGWYNNPQTFIQWRLLNTSGQPLDPAEDTNPWITEPFFYNYFNTTAGYTVRKFAHVKSDKFIEDIRIDDLLTSGGNISGTVLLEFRLLRASGNPSNPTPLRISNTVRHSICMQGIYTNDKWICANGEDGGANCFGRDVAGSREVPPCSPAVLAPPPGTPNIFTANFQQRAVPQEEGNPGGGRPLDIDRACGPCGDGDGNCASTSSIGSSTENQTQQGNILGNCYKNQNECGVNPFPMFNTFKVYCDAINGYFVPAGNVMPQALSLCTPNLLPSAFSSSSSYLLNQAYTQAQGPIEKLIGIPR